ncbi:hypothetical protein AB0B31_28305 [Catellatospora citrea]|uniref:hypothetical protein n=1 Tax=Catellatospora citrea TaxID=53366 RepID=UPI0033E02EA3
MSARQAAARLPREMRTRSHPAGLSGVTAHDLRATHASWVADSHGVLVAARRLGHANASVTTRHYARPIDKRDAGVAEHLNRQQAREEPSGTEQARDVENDAQ